MFLELLAVSYSTKETNVEVDYKMQLDLDTSMRLGADVLTHGKKIAGYILNYLEETEWFVPLDDVMRSDEDDDE